MRVAGNTSIGIGGDGAGLGAEYQAKNACGLVVDDRVGHFASQTLLIIGSAQVIVVIAEIASLGGESVGIGSHLDIETIEDGFVGIVGSAPVGDDHTIEIPVTL